MATVDAPGAFERVILQAIKAEIDRAVAEEEERAVAAVRERIRAQKATIALAVMRHFDIERGHDRILITVKDTVKD